MIGPRPRAPVRRRPCRCGSGRIFRDRGVDPWPSFPMNPPNLTGAQRTRLRGLGQTLSDSLRIGRQGPTPALYLELNRQLDSRELVKLRFEGADREERANLCARIATETPCVCVGAVGHTALFWRAPAGGSKRL